MVLAPFPQENHKPASTYPIKSVRNIKNEVKFKMRYYNIDFYRDRVKIQSNSRIKFPPLPIRYHKLLLRQIIADKIQV